MTHRTIVDVHIIQTVPPSNLNRDDTGSPKSAIFGGVRRARVSSQSWKRAIRKDFQQTLDPNEVGVRTKRLVDLVADRVRAKSEVVTEDESIDLASAVLTTAGIANKAPKKPRKTTNDKSIPEADALAFLSAAQIDALADYALEAHAAGDKPDKRTASKLADESHSIDIALFGRMVASDPGLNVDAACQVAHALSTHAVSNEFDYYTAVDDHKDRDESSGAGMVGVVEFNAATIYRFASVDVDRLAETLGDPVATGAAVQAFVRSMVTSMPSGKTNTFGNRTLPDAVVVSIRDDQPVSFVGAFEAPITSTQGRVAQSVSALATYAHEVAEAYGAAPTRSWVVGRASVCAELEQFGERLALPDVVAALGETVAARLAPA